MENTTEAVAPKADDDQLPAPLPPPEPILEPPPGTVEWLEYWRHVEGDLPSPIDVGITGATLFKCPELKWYNFDVYPHKIKLTNTGYTVNLGAKWKTERPYLEGGVFPERHVFSQIHFHWGPDLLSGCDHSVDQRQHPAEMHATFFKSDYMTQQAALQHSDGVAVVCYIIRHGVVPDVRLQRVIAGFERIREAGTSTRVGPHPLSELMPLFAEDYFLYWGRLTTVRGDSYTVRWIVPRVPMFATFEQMKEFRKLWNPWDEPNLSNNRALQPRGDRHVFLVNPHWCLYNSLLPIPRVPEDSISELSPEYRAKEWMLPPQNRVVTTE